MEVRFCPFCGKKQIEPFEAQRIYRCGYCYARTVIVDLYDLAVPKPNLFAPLAPGEMPATSFVTQVAVDRLKGGTKI